MPPAQPVSNGASEQPRPTVVSDVGVAVERREHGGRGVRCRECRRHRVGRAVNHAQRIAELIRAVDPVATRVVGNEASYFDGYFHRYFVRYVARNEDSYLSGSLPGNSHSSLPRSLPGCSPPRLPGSLPDSSVEHPAANLPSSLEKNLDWYWTDPGKTTALRAGAVELVQRRARADKAVHRDGGIRPSHRPGLYGLVRDPDFGPWLSFSDQVYPGQADCGRYAFGDDVGDKDGHHYREGQTADEGKATEKCRVERHRD